MNEETLKEIIRHVYSEELLKVKSRKYRIVFEQAWLKRKIEEGCKCERCESDKNLTVDHIVPLSLIENLTLDTMHVVYPKNLQILCKYCNRFKADRLDFSNPKTKPILKEFVDSI